MNITRTSAALLVFGLSSSAFAQQADQRLHEHPAVIVKKSYDQRGYDYASKFYPHPAWLYLLPEAPRPTMDEPGVSVSKARQQELARAAKSETTKVTAHVAR